MTNAAKFAFAVLLLVAAVHEGFFTGANASAPQNVAPPAASTAASSNPDDAVHRAPVAQNQNASAAKRSSAFLNSSAANRLRPNSRLAGTAPRASTEVRRPSQPAAPNAAGRLTATSGTATGRTARARATPAIPAGKSSLTTVRHRGSNAPVIGGSTNSNSATTGALNGSRFSRRP